jgi:UDP-2-acetamido-3-amino-2,3-dideoxy-glucuronate N-acetyltransferase
MTKEIILEIIQNSKIIKMIHKLADVQSDKIGENTSIWQFVIVLPGAQIGNNSSISSHCFIENDVIVGNNVTVKCGVYLWDGLRVGNSVFIGPNVTFTNDKYPRSKDYPEEFQQTIIEDGASIGAASVILGGITIGKGSMIGAGSVVTKDVPPNQLWLGSPAEFIRIISM